MRVHRNSRSSKWNSSGSADPVNPWTAGWATFCPRCGNPGWHSDDGRRHDCAQCGFVYFHNLAAGVSAVIRCAEDIALIVRGRDPGRGLLDLPGGFVDPHESLETAILREVREEIGLELPAPRYLFSIPNIYRYRDVDYWTIDAMFEFRLTERPVAAANDEVLAMYWRRPASVAPAEIAFVSVREAIRRLGGKHDS